MAAIRHIIQKEVFDPIDESIQGLVNVTKTRKKKKFSFLCLSVNFQDKPPEAYISRVKTVERKVGDKSDSRETYRRVKYWRLPELRQVDGKSVDTDVLEFDLHFEKGVFKWIASNVLEKKNFITCLYKVAHKFMQPDKKKPEFVNVDEERLKENLAASNAGNVEDQEAVLVQQDEYQEITAKEEEDLERVLSRDKAIQDATSFTEGLSKELTQLDDAIIHSLLGSEEQALELLKYVDQTLDAVNSLENRLSVYDELLSGVRTTMQQLSLQYNGIEVEHANLKALYEEVDEIVKKLDLSPRIEEILKSSPLVGSTKISDCTKAARDLQKAMNEEFSQGVPILQAVTEQKQRFSALSFEFCNRLSNHLCGLFTTKSEQMLVGLRTRSNNTADIITPHNDVHAELKAYTDLMLWLKEYSPKAFGNVLEAYIRSYKRVYDEEIKTLVSELRSTLSRSADTKKGGSVLTKMGSNMDIQMSMASLRQHGGSMMLSGSRVSGLSGSMADFGSTGVGSADSNKPKFDVAFNLLLTHLEPVCREEQKFCVAFFHFPRSELSAQMDDSAEGDGIDEEDSDTVVKKPAVLVINELVLPQTLEQLFASLLGEMEGLINLGDKLDGYNSVFLLFFVSRQVVEATESGEAYSYLIETLKKALVCIKRLFDKFVAAKVTAVTDMKVPRGSKCGVLPCVSLLRDFIVRAEAIVGETGRRTELDKAYQMLIDSSFAAIERAANEHQKTPADVVRLENYHEIHDLLSRFKIASIVGSREEAKKRYRQHQKNYVDHSLGRPLEKLSLFFEGVKSLMATGTKADEVGFRLDFSKTELRKCIREYPGKEVKKGLDKLYHKMEKDMSDASQLEVTWGNMQKAFIEQFKEFEDLIGQCYPGSNITLEFTIEDLINYISQAKSTQQ